MPKADEIQHIDEKSGDDIGENAEELPELTGYEKHLNESMSEKGYMAALKDSGYNIEQQLAAYSRGRQTGLQTLHNMVKGLFIDDKTGEMSAPVHPGFFQAAYYPGGHRQAERGAARYARPADKRAAVRRVR